MKSMFSVIAFASLAAGAALAGPPTSVQRGEWWNEYSGESAIPVPCLGPDIYVEGTEHVRAWANEFYTASGRYHFTYHFIGDAEFHDQYGNVWVGHGVQMSDGVIWIGVPGSWSFNATYTFKPVFGDGPTWQMQNHGRVTFNANGEMVVDRPPGDSWEAIERCLPAKSK